jgi:hypothetical protein
LLLKPALSNNSIYYTKFFHNEQLRETFLQELNKLMKRPDVDIWFADESGFEVDPRPYKRWEKKLAKPALSKTVVNFA